MFRRIFPLALQRVLGRRESSRLVFGVLAVSFSFVIVALSLVGSMAETNRQFYLNTYGEWRFAIPQGVAGEREWLQGQPWVTDGAVGTAEYWGTVAAPTRSYGFGAMDGEYIRLGRIRLEEGRFPAGEDEICLESNILMSLGLDFTLGAEVELPLRFPLAGGEGSCALTHTFVLTGILHDYTGVWPLRGDTTHQLLVGAVTTPETARALAREAETAIRGESRLKPPIPQYLFYSEEQDLNTARRQTYLHMQGSRPGFTNGPCENTDAFPPETQVRPERLYILFAAAVALAAVLCAYLMRLHEEVRSFAALRALGLTRGQLWAMLAMESLLLLLPAAAVGLLCGAELTWLALRGLLYTGSAPVSVVIPLELILPVLGLWALAVVAARLALLAVLGRVPLTGRLETRGGRGAARGRRGLSLVLACLFSLACIFTVSESIWPGYKYRQAAKWPDYDLDVSFFKANAFISPAALREISSMPGVRLAYGYNSSNGSGALSSSYYSPEADGVTVSFPGVEETVTVLETGDSALWADELALGGEELDAYDRGELALMILPSTVIVGGYQAPRDSAGRLFRPQGEVTLRLYHKELRAGALTSTQVGELTFPVEVRTLPAGSIYYHQALHIPYALVGSHAFFRRVLDTLSPGQAWCGFTGGQNYGYTGAGILVRENAGYVFSKQQLTKYCADNGILCSPTVPSPAVQRQEQVQKLVLLGCCGACVALVAALLLGGVLALERQQERRRFRILRALGMSRTQLRLRLLASALGRGVLALVSGGGLYLLYLWRFGARPGFLPAARGLLTDYAMVGSPAALPALAAGCVLVPFTICVLAKRGLEKEAPAL